MELYSARFPLLKGPLLRVIYQIRDLNWWITQLPIHLPKLNSNTKIPNNIILQNELSQYI